MEAGIRLAQAQQEVYTEERCTIIEVANDPGDDEVSIALAKVAPGVTTTWHLLVETNERYLILSGRGEVEIGSLQKVLVGPGDVVRIPAGTRQRITATSEAELIFYAVCTPPFRQTNYRSCE